MVAVPVPSYAQAVNMTAGLTQWAALLQRVPQDVMKTYSSLQNVTCFVPSDAAYNQYLSTPGFSSWLNDAQESTRAFYYSCVQGMYPADSFTPQGSIYHTLFTESSIHNITSKVDMPLMAPIQSRGLVLEGVRDGDQSMIYSGLSSAQLQANSSLAASRPTLPNFLFKNSTTNMMSLNSSVASTVKQMANIVVPDIKFSSSGSGSAVGILHVVDNLFSIPLLPLPTLAAALNLQAATMPPFVDIVNKLATQKDVTVFLPSNEAYAAFKKASPTLSPASNALMNAATNAALSAGQIVYSDSFTAEGMKVKTQNGKELVVKRAADGMLYVNGIKVVMPDLVLPNGVLHIIDGLLFENTTEAVTAVI